MGLRGSSLLIWKLVSQSVVIQRLENNIRVMIIRNPHLHFCIGPTRHFDNHVEDRLLLIGVERDIMPWRDKLAILFGEDAVLQCVCRSNLAAGVRHFGQALLLVHGGLGGL